MQQMNEVCEMALSNVIFMERGVECRKIQGFPGYFVGSNGVIFSVKKDGLAPLKPHVNVYGYQSVNLRVNGVTKTMLIHRIVAKEFISNPEGHNIVNHKSGVKTDNSVSNLEWTSQSENVQHAHHTGLISKSQCKEVIVTNIKTGETETFESLTQCAEHIGRSQATIGNAIKQGSLVKKTFKIEFTGIGGQKTDRTESTSEWRESIPEPVWTDGKMWMNGKECKPIQDCPGFFVSPEGYIISNMGKTPIVRKPSINNYGYKQITIGVDGATKTIQIHRVVATEFIPNPDGCCIVNHVDGDKQNNNVSNLEWVSQKENIQHAHRTGLVDVSKWAKMVRATDITTGKTETFISGAECARSLGCSLSNIGKAIRDNRLCMKRYTIEFVED